ncbi:amino acid ABC transporter substrate-binding protein [Salinisphaera sp. T31B1]|uniref:amino acid ABC transporter substrate-binding protein n=1 Tax=Salinisphaera sp. T31B1 TaxID=727963 RepID=UPI003342B290
MSGRRARNDLVARLCRPVWWLLIAGMATLPVHAQDSLPEAGSAAPSAAAQATPESAGPRPFAFGYIGWDDDPRYSEARTDQRFQGEPWGRPLAGAEVALDESKFPGIAAGVKFSLDDQLVANTSAAIAAIKRMQTQGTHFVLLDLPAGTVARIADEFDDQDLTFFNVAASDDRLRGAHCRADLLHTIPSDAMRNDALAQYLVSRQWSRVLVLRGPEPADAVVARSFARSAKRFGLDIVATRDFILGNNPREREQNNPKLITSGVDYDVVYIADTQGEFSRSANFAVQHPRPVVGAAGLVAEAWHWSWNKHGARQLNNRLERKADRPMTGYDWAAWAAVKAIVAGVQRTGSTDYAALRRYILSDQIDLDGFKGFRMAFRDFNGQLGQPMLLSTGNWVVAVAPLEGFLDPKNYLNTLGMDARESACRAAFGHDS